MMIEGLNHANLRLQNQSRDLYRMKYVYKADRTDEIYKVLMRLIAII